MRQYVSAAVLAVVLSFGLSVAPGNAQTPPPISLQQIVWVLQSTSWNTCSSSGKQTGTEVWTRTVLIPATGNRARGPLKKTDAVSQVCVYVPPVPPPVGNHGYFDMLRQRPDVLRAYSLRDPTQLDFPRNGGFAHSNTRPLVVTYDPATDPDPRKQDAAKIVIGTSSNSLTNQIHVPIPVYSGSLLVTWDAWMGKEFAYAVHGISNYKHFQLASNGAIWTEIRTRFSAASSGQIGLVDLRYYGMPGPSFVSGNLDALSPTVGSFVTAPERWTRYWVLLTPAGTWTELSLWVADEKRGPVQILDRALVQPKKGTRWDGFWLEYNTSRDTIKAGRPNLISYARNVVMLQGIVEPKPFLIRP